MASTYNYTSVVLPSHLNVYIYQIYTQKKREISIINVVNNYKRKKFLKKNISCDFERRESLNI